MSKFSVKKGDKVKSAWGQLWTVVDVDRFGKATIQAPNGIKQVRDVALLTNEVVREDK